MKDNFLAAEHGQYIVLTSTCSFFVKLDRGQLKVEADLETDKECRSISIRNICRLLIVADWQQFAIENAVFSSY